MTDTEQRTSEHNMTDYEQTRREFHLDVPEQFNWARDVVGKWAADPNHLAMLWVGPGGERRITFAEFDRRANQVAAALRAAGVRKGDRVAIMLPRVPEWWETVLGIMKLGAVSMPGTILLTTKDIAYRVATSDAVAVITDAAGAQKVEQARDQMPSLTVCIQVGAGARQAGWHDYEELVGAAPAEDPGEPTRSADPAMIYFTSGTVGYPKMVLHTYASYTIAHTITGKYWLDLTPNDLHWNTADNGWAKAAWSSLFGPWNMGAALFVQDSRGKFNAVETLQLLERYPITTFCAPPTVYRTLVLEDLKQFHFQSLRWCVGAGEPLNPEVIETWREATGLTIRDGYGQTESVLLVGNFPPLEVRPGSMGKPSPGFDVSVIDDAAQEVPPGKEGDIAVRVRPNRPIGLFQEYWRDPEATERAMRGDWYVTGDRAVKDADGYFWFVGRADDVIITAGYRIGPFEVESALVEHPAVAEAAVVSSPDALRGEIVKAFVILAPGYAPSDALVQELQNYVKETTAPYKYPREIAFVTELPKTISGKIRRVELREREWQKKPSSQ
jgi:acyl-coenzyme A synthetase/AMP-(fatty) acid ligase